VDLPKLDFLFSSPNLSAEAFYLPLSVDMLRRPESLISYTLSWH
jgi:hypothetical protein